MRKLDFIVVFSGWDGDSSGSDSGLVITDVVFFGFIEDIVAP